MNRHVRWTLAPVVAVLAVGLTACASAPASAHGDGDGDGDIPENGSISPFDTANAAIHNLDPALLQAVQKAAEDARARGVEVKVTSGWRSKEYQQRLLDQAVVKYGSLEQARRFVNTPEKSTHVSGKAVDIGPTRAADWFVQHGSDYGLCQAYANEMWHFELLTSPGGDCPQARSDAAG